LPSQVIFMHDEALLFWGWLNTMDAGELEQEIPQESQNRAYGDPPQVYVQRHTVSETSRKV